MNIYVGNLSYDVTTEDLQESFGAFGEVVTVKIIKDPYTDTSKGFGFVEMATKEQAQSAIADLNSKELKGRALKVNEANPRNDSSRGRNNSSSSGSRNRY
ncbi:MAG: RNA-binding protein [Spirochaetota bacterium]|nr:RNA-binding protein [Spirochaetota bacterium]